VVARIEMPGTAASSVCAVLAVVGLRRNKPEALEGSFPSDRMETHPSIRLPYADAPLVLSVTTRRKRKSVSLRVPRYTLSNEFHNFKTAYGMRMGASVSKHGTSLRDCFVGVRTDAAFDESIEDLWSGRVWSGGSCLHPHCQ